MKILILAGGTGKRLWPVSKNNDPKQNHSLIGNDTLLKTTCKRIRSGFNSKDIYFTAEEALKMGLIDEIIK